MNPLLYAMVLIAALTAKAGAFSFFLGLKKYNATVVESEHLAPLGRFSLAQAASIASQIATGSLSVTVRVGADDYALTVAPA